MTMSEVCDGLRVSHASYWELVRPAALTAPVEVLLEQQQQQQPEQQQEHDGDEGSQHEPDVLAALANTQVVLAATMDAGEVPCSTGAQQNFCHLYLQHHTR